MAVQLHAVKDLKDPILSVEDPNSMASLDPQAHLASQVKAQEDLLAAKLKQIHEIDDPLQLYVDHIEFLKPIAAQGLKRPLRHTLETTAHAFKKNPQYKNDPRYIQIWIEYSRHASDCIEVFKYVAQIGVGYNLALFYEEYAKALEHKKWYRQARQVFERGIQIQASPLSRLENSFAMFQDRTKNRDSLDEPLEAPLPDVSTMHRHALAPKNGSINAAVPAKRINVFMDDLSETDGSEEKPSDAPQRPFQVYQDSPQRPSPAKTQVVTIPAGNEKTMVNMDYIYQTRNSKTTEYCLEELIIQTRRLSALKFPRRLKETQKTIPPKAQVYAPGEPTVITSSANRVVSDLFKGYNNDMTATINSQHPDERTVPLYRSSKGSTQTAHQEQKPNQARNGRSLGFSQTLSMESPKPPRPTPQVPRMQHVVFEDLSNIKIKLPPGHPPSLPVVVDASLPKLRELLLPRINAALDGIPTFKHNKSRFGMLNSLKRSKPPQQLHLPGLHLTIKAKVGEGGYGTVWQAVNNANDRIYALKGEPTPIPWEVYIIHMARSRIDDLRVLESLCSVYYAETFQDEQYQLMPLFKYDTLLNVAKSLRARRASEVVVEKIAVYFAIEMIRTIEALHHERIIHGDFKAENIMLRAPKDIHANLQSTRYSSSGANGWSEFGIVLIDFGRSIDLELFAPNQKFKAGWSAQEQDSWEIQNNIPWTYEIDYHGLAGVVHVLLFSQYMKVENRHGRRSIVGSFKRYWNIPMWEEFFGIFLNATSGEPLLDEMARMRKKFESWLEADSKDLQITLNAVLMELKRRGR